MENIPIAPESCACIDSLPLAMAYVPMQKWRMIYDPNTALARGTMFRELDKPYTGEEAV